MTSRLNAQRIDHVTVGIGINLAMEPLGLPSTATTLSRESGNSVDRQQVLDVLLPKLDSAYTEFVAAKGEFDREGWTSRAAYLNERIIIDDAGELIEGTFTGIDTSGALLLELEDGTERKVISGEFTRGPRRSDKKS
jgi:BirA family biotin operon repressor/biotin-[acetyl-CoA-carboxylase] ligase